jgi:cytochrome c peroxidase
LRGLQLFNAPDKGNCAACHLSERQADGAFPAFSDFGLIALGVPRNRQLTVNHDPEYYDLGLWTTASGYAESRVLRAIPHPLITQCRYSQGLFP